MQFLKNLIIGSPLDPPLRKLIRRLRSRTNPEWTRRIRRDDANVERLVNSTLRTDSNCVDIGAHKGVFLDRFRELAPNGTHYAFEPLPHMAEALQKDYPEVRVFNCALSDHVGSATFYHVQDMEAWSGLEKQDYPKEAEVNEFEVELKPLDDILGPDVHIDFLKVDVEGAEHQVLKGAEEVLRRCRPVVLFEHARIHNEHYGTTPEMMFELFVDRCGMEILDLALTRPFTREEFRSIYDRSHASGYDRHAQTNFVARAR